MRSKSERDGSYEKRRIGLDLLWIAAVGLLIQAFWAQRIQYPTYMDAYYYATNGQRLADGYGFSEEIIWQFLDQPQGIPTPSHTYWMPFPSMLAAPGYKLAGSFRGMQLPFWVMAGLLPLLGYAISMKISGKLWQARTAALLTASSGFYVNYLEQPSTFAPFAWAGGLCLFALAKTSEDQSSRLWWMLAGVTAGLGHLTRADGLLLLGVGGIIWGVRLVGFLRNDSERKGPEIRLIASKLALLFSGYLVVMAGWFIRNWLVLGRPLTTTGTQTLFLTTYDDLFAYGRSFNLTHLLEWGWGNIIQSKLAGLSIAAQTFVAVGCFTFLAPFVVWAWFRLRKDQQMRRWLRPVTWYTGLLYFSMSVLFTFPGGRGGLFHSSIALWPWFMAFAAHGIEIAVDWMAQRLPHWQPERAKRIFSALFVGVSFLVSVGIGLSRTPDYSEAQVYAEMRTQLPDDAVVMVGNSPGFYFHTGLKAVSIPNEPVETLLLSAQQYNVTHLILDENYPRPLEPLYLDDLQFPGVTWVQDIADKRLFVVQQADQ